MGNRSLDIGIVELLRNLVTRVGRLEAQNNAVRRNDIRIGEMVLTTNTAKGTLEMTNVNTKAQDLLGIPEPAMFSYSGALSVTGGDTDYGPSFVMPKGSVVTEIALALREVAASVVTVQVWMNSGKSMVTVSLPAGETLIVSGANMPVEKNTQIYPRLTAGGTDAHDLSVTVRFGYPLTGDLSADES